MLLLILLEMTERIVVIVQVRIILDSEHVRLCHSICDQKKVTYIILHLS